MNNREKIVKLSGKVLRFSRNTLLVSLRFLDVALSRLEFVPNEKIFFGTDGRFLVCNPKYLLKRYTADEKNTVHDYLHTLLHCIFRHNFVGTDIDRRLWNLACDIAVENVINELNVKSAETASSDKRNAEISSFKLNTVTAEKLYKYFKENSVSISRIETLERLFSFDDHSLWYMSDDEKSNSGIGNNNKNQGNDSQNNDNQNNDNQNNENQDTDNSQDNNSNGMPSVGSEEDWKDISERIQVDMETFSREQGDSAGGFLQGLREINREKYDYSAFLK